MRNRKAPKRLYLLRAMLEWIEDSGDVPYLLVDAAAETVEVPPEHVQNKRIVLNIGPAAVGHLHIDEEGISCEARFAGVARPLFVPLGAALAIYGRRSGDGLVFPDESSFGEAEAVTSQQEQPATEERPDKPVLKLLD